MKIIFGQDNEGFLLLELLLLIGIGVGRKQWPINKVNPFPRSDIHKAVEFVGFLMLSSDFFFKGKKGTA